jgi:hypothetical protein
VGEAKPEWLHLGTEEAEEKIRSVREALNRMTGPQPEIDHRQLDPGAGSPVVQRPPIMRRKFRQDGEVTVERRPLVDGGVNRREQMDMALKFEREARDQVEADLTAALGTIETLKTKLGHIEIALQEAVAGRAEAERRLAELSERREPEAIVEPPPAAVAPVRRRGPGRKQGPFMPPKKPKAAPDEQQPIWFDHWSR